MTLKRGALIGFQIVLAILVGLAIREVWLARSGNDTTVGPAPETVGVEAHVTPSVHVFGEPIVATVEVVADATAIKPETIRVETDFEPYAIAGTPTVDRSVVDGIARVVFRYPLRCLGEGCDAAEARGIAEFPEGFVRYRFVEGSGPGRQLLEWPSVEVASRVTPADLEAVRWRASETALPATTMRIGPIALAIVLLAIAAALVGVAIWLARRLWRTEPEDDVVDAGPVRSSLERALRLALADAHNGAAPAERRRALERLARELATVDQPGLADDARALAWSPSPASNDEIAGFARRVEDATGAVVA